MFTPRVYFITPVYKRFALTAACLRQRRAMLDALPFEAQAVIIGDDENLKVAEDLGFEVVRKDNSWVGRKFNAGYYRAIRECGATHVMPIGSDSFLHPCAFEDAPWSERRAFGMIGLSSISPWGDERLDLQIKYPAGFGVGMVYPAFAITAGKGAAPDRQKGIDTSTWNRCGRGRVQIEFLAHRPVAYTNFHSPDEQITDYFAVRGTHARKSKRTTDVWTDIRAMYGDEATDDVMAVYAMASLGVFLTGERPTMVEKINPKLPGHRGRPTKMRLGLHGGPKKRGIPYIGDDRYTEFVENFRDIAGTP